MNIDDAIDDLKIWAFVDRGRNKAGIEESLATRIRQFFRALAARDQLATSDEYQSVIYYLWILLVTLIPDDEEAKPWRGLAEDGMTKVQYRWTPPGRFQISGGMFFIGGEGDSLGPEPFYADVVVSDSRTDTVSYHLRFGRREGPNTTPLPAGIYPSMAKYVEEVADPWDGKADWLYEFMKLEADSSDNPL